MPDDSAATPPTPLSSGSPQAAHRPPPAMTLPGATRSPLSAREQRRNAAETVATAAAALLDNATVWQSVHAVAMLAEAPTDTNAASVMLDATKAGDAATMPGLLDALSAAVTSWRQHQP